LTPHDRPTPLGEERVRLLEQVAHALGRAPHSEGAILAAAQAVVRSFAHFVVLVVRRDGQDDWLEVLHRERSREGLSSELLRGALPAIRRLADYDMRRRREFRWIRKVNDPALKFLRNEPELQEAIHQLEIRSLMVVPLRSSSAILGGMAFVRSDDAAPFEAADLATAQVIARRIASALETAELHGRALDEPSRSFRLEGALQKWIQVFDRAGWGAAIVDGQDQRIEAVNPAFARIHGYNSSEDLGGNLFTELLPPERSDEPARWNGKAEGSTYESLHVRANGTVFPVLTNVTPLTTEQGVNSYVVTIQDLTDLKRTEERLLRAQRLEAVGRLAGGVAHEVNNMMTIILGFSDLLSRTASLPPERQRDVEEIRKAATRAGKTTQQLLAFSRQQILQPVDLEINDVVNDLLPALRLLLPANILLETSLTPAGVRVHADRAQLDQVLINLAFNARDAMPEGGTLRLITDSRWLDSESGHRLIGIPIPPGRYATVSVVDTGHGMDAATVTQVFEPFFTTKPVGSGTGLGLATVYGIVKQSGGFVWVDSTREVGTTLTVCLPQIERAAEPLDAALDGEIPPARCQNATVLVVEDEDGVRDLVRRVLEQLGHRVVEAKDGPAALEVLENSADSLDLVLSDVIVPDIGTSELEHDVRRRRPNLPILYMSGYSRDEMVERGLVPSDGPFLQKPFTGEELGELVCQQLELAEARGGTVST
jgi:PAS domain S-box-containing protein